VELNPELPEKLQEIIGKTLEKDRELRCQTAAELRADLKRLRRNLDSGWVDSGSSSGTGGGSGRVRSESSFSGITRAAPSGTGFGPLAAAPAGQPAKRKSTRAIDSLVILPFANLSGDPEMDYLSDGLAETLIYSLSQVRKLRVVPRDTAFRYKGKGAEALTAGRELGARAVLSGRVAQRGALLAVSVDLVDVLSESQIWGAQFTRSAAEILSLQEEITREAVGKLRVRLTPEEKRRLTRRETSSTEAYELYLKGRHALEEVSRDGWTRAAEHFQEAITKDPNYALGYAGLAEAYALLGLVVQPSEVVSKASAAARHALTVDDNLAEAHLTLAFIFDRFDWDWPGADGEYRRAIQLNPRNAHSRARYSLYLMRMRRWEEALAEAKTSLELDPQSAANVTDLGWLYYHQRDYDRAIEQFRAALAIDPKSSWAHHLLGCAFAHRAMHQEAVREMREAVALSESPPYVAGLCWVLAAAGRSEESAELLNPLVDASARRYGAPYRLAWVYAGAGDRERSFEWLQKAFEQRDPDLSYVRIEPAFDSIRDDARYPAFLRRLGLEV
jgi:TolB-like protein/Tfp pilus assembly protein PilF